MRPDGEGSLTIGAVAKATGVSIDTIRYYERIGLLDKPPRGANGHRYYSTENADAVSFISRSRQLGFALSTIRDLMRLGKSGGCCDKVREIALAHREDIREQIDGLQQIERSLSELVARCSPDTLPNCPIMDELKAPP